MDFHPPGSFSTSRLVARKPRVEDAPAAFAAYAGDAEVTRYLAWKKYDYAEPLAEFLTVCLNNWQSGTGHFAWFLCLAGTDTPIGMIGCTPEGGKVMFGYVLGQKHWHQGLMAEALTFLVNWWLAQPDIYRAWAFCDVENPASARVMEKSGMTREGLLRRWHVCPNLGPEPRDCLVYAKVKE